MTGSCNTQVEDRLSALAKRAEEKEELVDGMRRVSRPLHREEQRALRVDFPGMGRQLVRNIQCFRGSAREVTSLRAGPRRVGASLFGVTIMVLPNAPVPQPMPQMHLAAGALAFRDRITCL